MAQGKRAYRTRQSVLVLEALTELGEGHITAEHVARLLKDRGEDVGTATVYRNLDKLVQEGQVVRYTLPGSASACYQLLADIQGCEPHCHAICVRCGEITHLDCGEVKEFAAHLEQHHSFQLDMRSMVFYGLCSLCLQKENEGRALQ